MTEIELGQIAGQVDGTRDVAGPPLHLWHPPLSGDIDIVIRADGSWWHEGGIIQRDALVRLFASILRREEDGDYYLVTPVEKWRISVQLHPLLVVDIEAREQDGQQSLLAILNTGREVVVGSDHPLSSEPAAGGAAVLALEHGLTALFSRAAWYRLVGLAEVDGDVARVTSGGSVFELAAG